MADQATKITGSTSRTIKIGAEARIDLIDWQGQRAISKTRIPKTYRNGTLDQRLRTRRTKEETEILLLAKLARVDCPKVFFVDPKKSEIVMEYIDGELLKDVEAKYQTSNSRQIDANLSNSYITVGKYAARLHQSNIIHGDLTTKNVIIVTGENRLVLIDFGLSFYSERIEDRAEDLHLLKQALMSTTSSRRAKTAFDLATRGYRIEAGQGRTRQILRKISEIEKRGRYARVD